MKIAAEGAQGYQLTRRAILDFDSAKPRKLESSILKCGYG